MAEVILSVFPIAWILGRADCFTAHDHPRTAAPPRPVHAPCLPAGARRVRTRRSAGSIHWRAHSASNRPWLPPKYNGLSFGYKRSASMAPPMFTAGA